MLCQHLETLDRREGQSEFVRSFPSGPEERKRERESEVEGNKRHIDGPGRGFGADTVDSGPIVFLLP